jgi:hypothetical protein
MLKTLIAAVLEQMLGSLTRYWKAGAKTSKEPSRFMKALGLLFIAGLIGFCLLNLYHLIVSGVVFWPARRNQGGWIIFEDHPIAFVIWSTLYSVPLLGAALLPIGFIMERRANRRTTLRHFTDGIGPPPRVQVIDPSTFHSDRPSEQTTRPKD